MHDRNGFKIDTSISFSDILTPEQLKQPVEIVLPFSGGSTAGEIKNDTLRAIYKGRNFGNDKAYMLPQDNVILSFLKNNNWKRPVYFCSTVSPDNFLGLDSYLRYEGIVSKLVPAKGDSISPSILENNLLHKYKYRSLNDRAVPIDNATKNIFMIFRNGFYRLILFYKQTGNKARAKELFDIMQEKLPPWRFTEKENELFNGLIN
jgi:hypothetical protein